MATMVRSKSTGEIITSQTISDMLGRSWKLGFAIKPGMRGQPEGEIYVFPEGKAQKMKGFAPYFFPDLEFVGDT